jgi:hypothetical protein
VLIQCLDEGVSPVALVGEVLGEVERTKEFASRFISRMIPLERVGYSGVDEIREVARPLIEQHLDAYKQRFAGESEVPPLEVRPRTGVQCNESSGDVLTDAVTLAVRRRDQAPQLHGSEDHGRNQRARGARGSRAQGEPNDARERHPRRGLPRTSACQSADAWVLEVEGH